jgi:MFS superfamily sulfate permease-like transporter
MRGYDLGALRADLISGITVALVLVPQSMAYAQLAGLPAHYGLYAALLPPVVASLFGSSRLLATGPVAVVSLMTSATLEPLATAGSASFVLYALLLALLVGVFQFTLGLLRLGVVINFLSHPVTIGFTNAAALIIATSQLSRIFGVYVDKGHHHYETVLRVIETAWGQTHWPTLLMAVLSFAVMIVLRKVNPRIPNVLVAVVIATALSWALHFEQNERVALDRIRSPRAIELVEAFNQAVHAKTNFETLRAGGERRWHDLGPGAHDTCLLCHEPRDPAVFVTGSGPDRPDTSTPTDLLTLHNLAGLLDRRLEEIKHSISEVRTELRGKFFVAARDAEGQRVFLVRGDDVPSDLAPEDGTWKLLVGSQPLNTDGLVLSGGGAVVGTIPEGLPAFTVPQIDWLVAARLVPSAIVISLLGFMEAISIAKVMAARKRQKLDPNQELIGQGLANILGAMAQSYAVSGSFSRSAVNFQAGGRTGLSNVFSSVVVMIVLLFFAGTLYHLPQAVLASIIMMAVVGLINFSGFLHAWRTSRIDGLVSVITFVGTLWFAPHLEWGIFIGVGLSIGAYLYRTTRPAVVELAPHPEGTLRDAERHGLDVCRYISVVRFEGPLYFASASYLESEVLSQVAELPELRHFHIAGHGITEVDASGEETLRNLVENLRTAGYAVSFSGLSESVLDVLRRARLYDKIGGENFYGTDSLAIAAVYASAHAGVIETDCPYRQAMPPVVELSLHEDGSLRDAERHGLDVCRHIAALRFDAPLNFANTSFLEQEILHRFADRPTLRHILFVGHGISDVDALGAERLTDLTRKLVGHGFAVSFSGLKEDVVDVLRGSGIMEIVGEKDLYPTQLIAVSSIFTAAHTGSSEVDCPLQDLAPRLTELSWHHTKTLRDVQRHLLPVCRKIGVLRLDGPSVLYASKPIQSEFIRWAKARSGVEYVVFLVGGLHKLSGREARTLGTLVAAVREAGYRIAFANFTDRAFEDLVRSGVADEIGVDDIYPTAAMAVASLYHDAHADGAEAECPLHGLLPPMVELSLHPDGSLRDARRHGLALCERIVAVRFDGPLDFAHTSYFEHELRRVLAGRPEAKHIIFAAHTLGHLDPLAAEELCGLLARLGGEGYVVVTSGLRDDELDLLRRASRNTALERLAVLPTQAKAIEQVHEAAHRGAREDPCPLVEVVRRPM